MARVTQVPQNTQVPVMAAAAVQKMAKTKAAHAEATATTITTSTYSNRKPGSRDSSAGGFVHN